jgi:hypothetical protein
MMKLALAVYDVMRRMNCPLITVNTSKASYHLFTCVVYICLVYSSFVWCGVVLCFVYFCALGCVCVIRCFFGYVCVFSFLCFCVIAD